VLNYKAYGIPRHSEGQMLKAYECFTRTVLLVYMILINYVFKKYLNVLISLITIKIRRRFKEQSVKNRTFLQIKRTHPDRNFWVDKEDMSEGDRTRGSPSTSAPVQPQLSNSRMARESW
jgi:hypothetical protein